MRGGYEMKGRLKELRTELCLSQEEFGKGVGVNKASVSGWESGRRNLSEQSIMLICDKYNVNLSWLKYGEGNMFINIPDTVIEELTEKYNLDELDREIVINYLKLNENQRDVIKDLLKNIFGLNK